MEKQMMLIQLTDKPKKARTQAEDFPAMANCGIPRLSLLRLPLIIRVLLSAGKCMRVRSRERIA